MLDKKTMPLLSHLYTWVGYSEKVSKQQRFQTLPRAQGLGWSHVTRTGILLCYLKCEQTQQLACKERTQKSPLKQKTRKRTCAALRGPKEVQSRDACSPSKRCKPLIRDKKPVFGVVNAAHGAHHRALQR